MAILQLSHDEGELFVLCGVFLGFVSCADAFLTEPTAFKENWVNSWKKRNETRRRG
jgi:hypothetical protein